MKILIANLANRKATSRLRRELGYFLELYGPIQQVVVVRKSNSCVAIVDFVDSNDCIQCMQRSVMYEGKLLKMKEYRAKKSSEATTRFV